jgi:hypothetical protein
MGAEPLQARRKLPDRKKGLFGRKVDTAAMNGSDGTTMAHKGMPAILQHGSDGQAPATPGPISGYGGGTFEMDGRQATPIRPEAPAQRPLGGSMRQPFDYDAAMKALTGDYQKPKGWQYALAAIGDALARNGGHQGFAVQNIVNQQNAHRQRQLDAAEKIAGWRYDDWERQNEADLRASAPYTIGRERLGYDPATGQTEVLYRGRQDAEIYADTLGFDRGSEEWNAAVEDYVLKSSGPSAHQRDKEIDDYRTGNDRELEQLRYGNRVGLENLRQGNRLQLRRTPAARRSGGGGSKASGVGTVATDGKGNSVVWNGKAWVPNQ